MQRQLSLRNAVCAMRLHGLDTQVEQGRDFLADLAFCQQLQDFSLPCG
jgi:hypothetical protein